MKHFLSIFLLSFCLNSLSAQEKHFVFIQSENKQPFYVSVNGKLFSSTASGYLIIPKLVDGNYNFTVGFAQNAFPEQTFNASVQNKDLGFELKNFGDKGWGLFNLQSLDITMASSANTNVVAKALSETANSKADNSVISFEKKKKTPEETVQSPVDSSSIPAATPVAGTQQPANPDTATAVAATEKTEAIESTSKKKSSAPAKQGRATGVKKVSESTSAEGVSLSYVEGSGKGSDTIHVIIPTSGVDNDSKNKAEITNNANGKSESVAAVAQSGNADGGKSDLKFLDISTGSKKDSVPVTSTTPETFKVMENSNCRNIATDEDYAKLRKKMAAETTDEKMISEAKKYYRNKCFTTSQIKGLSTLFLSDEGRFKFFDASFVSVADANQYYTLQTEFIDPAFVSRFKGLLQ